MDFDPLAVHEINIHHTPTLDASCLKTLLFLYSITCVSFHFHGLHNDNSLEQMCILFSGSFIHSAFKTKPFMFHRQVKPFSSKLCTQ